MYLHTTQRLSTSMCLLPCQGLARSRYHQTAYRILMIQNLVNRRPMKTTLQRMAGKGSRSFSGQQCEGKSSPHLPSTSSTLLSSPQPGRKKSASQAFKEEGIQATHLVSPWAWIWNQVRLSPNSLFPTAPDTFLTWVFPLHLPVCLIHQ